MENLEDYKTMITKAQIEKDKNMEEFISGGGGVLTSLCIGYSGDRKTLSDNFANFGTVLCRISSVGNDLNESDNGEKNH